MVASNCSRLKGRTPLPLSAPNRTALTTLPARSAASAMSKLKKCRAASRAWRASPSLSTRPSPMADFSAMEYTRWLEAISVVRSRVTKPRCTARPASISSDASTTSTSPGMGMSASTGARAGASAAPRNSST